MPSRRRSVLSAIIAALLVASPVTVLAHGGEDHSAPAMQKKAAAPVAVQTGFAADGSVFQAVMVPDGTHSRIYIADADTNEPISGATIGAEAGVWRGAGRPSSEKGVYDLDWSPDGTAADLTLMVSAAGRDDLILIQVSKPSSSSSAAGQASSSGVRWTAAGSAGGALLVGGIALARRRRRVAAGAAALAVLLAAGSAFAHGGEDHGAPAEEQPKVVPGAVLTMPKATQFMLGVRTVRIEAKEAADTMRVVGRVAPDPDGYARVQSSQPARIISDPAFPFPLPGRQVRRGQVLMVLEPTLTSLERSDKRASLYKVESEIAIQDRELARQEALAGNVPAKLVEQTRIRLDQLRKERNQLAGTALGRDTILAPVDGTITDVHVVPGEVVGTDKVLIEIVDPQRLRVDAVIHDLAAAEQVTAATAVTKLIPDQVFALTLLGVSPRVDPQDQGVHAQFAVSGKHARRLKLGMPVDVFLATGTTRMSMAVPREAVAEVGGRQVVFVRTAPESFETRPVKVGQVVGPLAEIVEGVRPGDRVVTQGVGQIKAVR